MSRNFLKLLLILSLFSLTSCAALHFETLPVNFEDPVAKLHISPAEATPEEQLGVVLRFKPSLDKEYVYKEETTLYAQIQNGIGKQVQIEQERREHYQPGSEKDTYLLDSVTHILPNAGTSEEHLVIDSRGAIQKFISAKSKSKEGEIQILGWKRTNLFPESAVKVQDHWKYQENIELMLHSLLIKHDKPSEVTIDAENKLTGFAMIGSKRCAVIETEINQTKQEKLKVFFIQTITVNIQTQLHVTTYFDYIKGEVVARVATSTAHTKLAGTTQTDTSQSQSVFYTTA